MRNPSTLDESGSYGSSETKVAAPGSHHGPVVTAGQQPSGDGALELAADHTNQTLGRSEPHFLSNLRSACETFLFSAYSSVIRVLRSSPRVFGLLFGFTPRAEASRYGEYWDWSTLILKRALNLYCSPALKLLDLGTGPTAVLAIYARQRLQCCNVTASDHVPEVVGDAELEAKAQRTQIRFSCGDLFEGVPERFDLILFNAPYLAASRCARLGILYAPFQDVRCVGGEDGCETIRRFLADAPGHLTPNGRIALGVTPYHVSRARVQALISESELRCLEEVRSPLVPSVAYILVHAAPEMISL